MPLWREIQKENIISVSVLSDFLELDELNSKQLIKSSFPLNLPQRLARKIAKNRLDDPILKQFVPVRDEEEQHQDDSIDPLREIAVRQTPKILKKYKQRILLLATSGCGMHCRYCFRRHFPYEKQQHGFEHEYTLIEQDKSLREVILSGGDPLTLANSAFEELVTKIGSYTHLKRLRLHTRFPIGIPERIDTAFLHILENVNLQIWFVIHCNHPVELDDDVVEALQKIRKLGIPVLNQSVLLKGVNDSVDTLQMLSEKLVDAGIIPYYLHQLDRVRGASHFHVDEKRGIELIEELRKRVSGYAVPQYVKEISGEESKVVIA